MSRFLLGFFSFGWLRGIDFLAPILLRFFLAPLLWISGSRKLGLFSSEDFVWTNLLSWMNIDNPFYQATVLSLKNISFIPEVLAPTVASSIGILEVVAAFFLCIGFAIRWISLPLLALMALTAFIALNGDNMITINEGLVLSGSVFDMESTLSKSLVYFLMTLSLFFMGAGRFFSIDWFLYRSLYDKIHDTSGWAGGVRVGADIKPAPLVNNAANENRISQDVSSGVKYKR